MPLNPKQERFCQEYIIDLNATQAAIRAGYSEKTSYSIGQELLKKPETQAFIAELQKERSERTQITQDAVLNELWSIATDDIKNYLSFKSITLTNINPITDLPEEYNKIDVAIKDSHTIATKNISEISIGKDGQFKFKLYGRDAALVNVGKHLGMFRDIGELTIRDEIDMDKLSATEKLTYLKLFKKARS